MAGEEGFEPSVHDTKNRCLTTWLLPKGENILLKSGGGSRIRTYEVEDSGFTVRPSWPLWYPSVKWWALTGSNRRPHACKACALPAELSAHMKLW